MSYQNIPGYGNDVETSWRSPGPYELEARPRRIVEVWFDGKMWIAVHGTDSADAS